MNLTEDDEVLGTEVALYVAVLSSQFNENLWSQNFGACIAADGALSS